MCGCVNGSRALQVSQAEFVDCLGSPFAIQPRSSPESCYSPSEVNLALIIPCTGGGGGALSDFQSSWLHCTYCFEVVANSNGTGIAVGGSEGLSIWRMAVRHGGWRKRHLMPHGLSAMDTAVPSSSHRRGSSSGADYGQHWSDTEAFRVHIVRVREGRIPFGDP